jgi:hypothetical protein
VSDTDNKQEDLDPEIMKLVNENFQDLLYRSKADDEYRKAVIAYAFPGIKDNLQELLEKLAPTNKGDSMSNTNDELDKIEVYPLEELGVKYHVATERFDRRICKSYEHSDKAIPTDAWERKQCNRNAMYETHKAQGKAKELFGLSAGREMIKWIQKTANHPEVERRLR